MKKLLLTVVVLLSGCAASVPKDESSPFYQISTGSVLSLEAPLTIPAKKVSILFQYGEVLPPSYWFDQYEPYCKFELWTKNQTAVTVNPDRFTIHRVVVGSTPILVGNPSLMVASAGGLTPLLMAKDDDGDSSYLRFYTELYLQSAKQPDVYRLTCNYIDDPWVGLPLSIQEIRAALGEVFTLRLAEESK